MPVAIPITPWPDIRPSAVKLNKAVVAKRAAPVPDLATESSATIVECLGSKIHIGPATVSDYMSYIARTIVESQISSAYLLVTDTTVAPLHLEPLCRAFEACIRPSGQLAAPRLLTYTIPSGESNKTRRTKEELEDWMLEAKLTRDTVVVALGGGVVGDLVAFTAATYMRGLRINHIPTTLLAMVDSAIGGKTAVDTPLGKNMVGAFHPAEHIFVFAQFLATLPDREISNGFAEVIKTAAIRDSKAFATLNDRATDIWKAFQDMRADAAVASTEKAVMTLKELVQRSKQQSGHTESENILPINATEKVHRQMLLRSLIISSITVKSQIVNGDPHETTGLRNLVNFGHTIGHAIEAILMPEALHGESVAVGMILEARIAVAHGHLALSDLAALERCLRAYHLPTSMSAFEKHYAASSLSTEALLQRMSIDKKNSGSTKRIVLLASIGTTLKDSASAVADEDIAAAISTGATVSGRAITTSDETLPTARRITVVPPGSKSISNRALLLAALSSESTSCRITNLLHSDDTRVMIDALRLLGAADISFDGTDIIVQGRGGAFRSPEAGVELYMQNAGTAARFLTAACLLAKPANGTTSTVLTGNERMKKRPIADLVAALDAAGAGIEHIESQDFLPLRIQAHGGFPIGENGRIRLSAATSSQYVSAILMCAPLAVSAGAAKLSYTELELVGDHVVSQSYIDMTIAMMAEFGVHVRRVEKAPGSNAVYRIPRCSYQAPATYVVESDASSATYPLALAAATRGECFIPSLGSASKQGDAGFAGLLQSMGCYVEQTPTSTLVRGPSEGPSALRQLGHVDMEPLTDAFLTAAVLFAIAGGGPADGAPASTRITGIANQRVKECDRIRAMMDQLARFGVDTTEHEDGLEISPRPLTEFPSQPPTIHCYDDHRVAMAFSILGAATPAGCIIEDKRCTAKTWPNWFEVLSTTLGVHVSATQDVIIPAGVELPSEVQNKSSPAQFRPVAAQNVAASIVCIGMRGSGKTHIGRIAADSLGRTFIDADEAFEERHGNLASFVAQRGWAAFRVAELELLHSLLTEHPHGAVISLGGGIVETQEARELLMEYSSTKGPVVWIQRDLADLTAFLEVAQRPAYGESVADVYARREPYFARCSSYRFTNPISFSETSPTARPISDQVASYFGSITGQRPRTIQPLSFAKRTYMVSFNAPSVAEKLDFIDDIVSGSDALELRVDCLAQTGPEHVAQEVALLRSAVDIPIIFTVRSVSQGGKFPDNQVTEYCQLLRVGLELACEYVDVELRLDQTQLASIQASKGASAIIASWHDIGGVMPWGHHGEPSPMMERYLYGAQFGDIVKLIGQARSINDNHALKEFREAVLKPGNRPLLAINMSPIGQLSRILNPVLGPVTHSYLAKAAPGQLSFAQIQTGLALLGMSPERKFCLFGHPISQSLSPAIHNAAFGHMGLPFHYEACESATVGMAITERLADPQFGGASVTIPHKVSLMAYMDEVTDDAQAIGAINTIIPFAGKDGKRLLRGDNTDWLAIHTGLVRGLTACNTPAGTRFEALVLGAGGTARAALYALHKAGASSIALYNRTSNSARALAATLPSTWNVHVIESLITDMKPSAIVSTVPSGALVAAENAESGTFVPPTLLSHPRGGAIIDMAYTSGTSVFSDMLGTSAGVWTLSTGVEMLLEQAFAQSQLFTGRRPPRNAMRAAAVRKLL